MTQKWSNPAAGLTIILLCLLLFSDPFGLFAYQRGNIIQGEYWRFLSGHFTHTSGNHLFLNFFAWVLICIYGWPVLKFSTWMIAFAVCALSSSTGFFILLPELDYYEGLSGMLHGMLIVAALLRLQVSVFDITAWIAIGFLIGKLVYESIYGPSLSVQSLIELPILIEAHLYGAVSGILSAVVLLFFGKIQIKKTRPVEDRV